MFVQVIQGRCDDPSSLRDRLERWQRDLAEGADGWLGSTGGVTDDGIALLTARFASPEAARANSERPEQGEWWSGTEACFTGPVTFADFDDVRVFRGGGADDAGFVQAIRGRMADVPAAVSLMDEMDETGDEHRPEVLGGFVGLHPDGTYAQLVYFTSEADAREGEATDTEIADSFAQLQAEPPTFLDLRGPWFASPTS